MNAIQLGIPDITHESASGKDGTWEWFVEWSDDLGGWTARFVMPSNWHYPIYDRERILDEHKQLRLKVWDRQEDAIAGVLEELRWEKKRRRERGMIVP